MVDSWKSCQTPIVVLLFVLVALSIFCLCMRRYREPFTNTPVVADLIFVYSDGPDSKNFTPTWAKFTDDYRDTLEDVGVRAHKFKNTDAEVKQYSLKGYPTILLTAPDHGAVITTFKGTRSVPELGSFVHTTYPAFDKTKYRSS